MWLASLIIARDVGLAISAIYYRWISLPPPKTMARYWDFSLPSAEVRPTAISKANTALQLLLVGATVAVPVVPEAIINAWSLQEGLIGLQYVYSFFFFFFSVSFWHRQLSHIQNVGREECFLFLFLFPFFFSRDFCNQQRGTQSCWRSEDVRCLTRACTLVDRLTLS